MIVFFSFYFIYHQLSENKSFEELDLTILIETVKQNIEKALIDFKNRIKISLVPNITNIC